MNKQRVRVLALITACFVLLSVAMHAHHRDKSEAPELFFPGLAEELNAITRIRVVQSERAFTLDKTGSAWVIPELQGYPADVHRVRDVLWGLAELQRVSAKTKKPRFFEQLGLEDTDQPGSHAVRLVLEREAGLVAASLLVGKTQMGRVDNDQDELFVREGQEPAVFLAAGHVPLEREPLDWVERHITDIDVMRIHTVHIESLGVSREPLSLQRASTEAHHFELADLADHESVLSEFALDSLPRTLSHLLIEQVWPWSEDSSWGQPVRKMTLRTFDGLTITCVLYKHQDDTRVRVEASASSQVTGSKEGEQADDRLREAQAFNDRHADWWYTVPSYQLDDLNQTRDDWVSQPQDNSESSQHDP